MTENPDKPHMLPHQVVCLGLLMALALTARGSPGLLDTIGYNNLTSGGPSALMAYGSGVPVAQVEVVPAGTQNYIPDTSREDFSGKTFTLRSGPSGVSPHATQIAGYFYSSQTGAAPNVSSINLFSAESFITGLLRVGRSNKAPGSAGARVINNSWVASFSDGKTNVDSVRRLDDLINRDGVLVFNAVKNENDGAFPYLMSSSYNGITVGTLTSSRGPISIDSAGSRIKPDIVVPVGFTSDATALASGAGALLFSEAKARKVPFNQLAAKAVLLGGALRDDTWQRGAPGAADDAKAPLDHAQGAGKLRIDRSVRIFNAGRGLPQGAGTVQTTSDAAAGWDTNRTNKRSKSATYNLHLAQDEPEWSAVLTWNRVIAGLSKGRYNSTPTLADLTLSLYRKPAGRKPYLIATSDSDYDNIESLTLHDLPAGDYRLLVTSSVRTWYGVSWFGDPDTAGADVGGTFSLNLSQSTALDTVGFSQVPEPSMAALLALIACGFANRRSRR
jgi:hypothetical protein